MDAGPTPARVEAREPTAGETRVLLLIWVASLALLFGGATAWIVVVRPDDANLIWVQVLALATLPGKYVIFSGLAEHSPLGPWSLGVLAVFVDFAVGATLAVGLGPLGRVPFVGPTLRKGHDRAERVLDEYPRLRRMAFWGVVLFVFLPLPASGSIGGTFVGQMLGLSRVVGLWAVVLGGAIVSATFAALAVAVGSQARAVIENPWVGVAAGVVFVAAAYFAYRATRGALKR